MRRSLTPFIAILLLATGCQKPHDQPTPEVKKAPPAPASTEAEARILVEKAIAAHGGEAAIAKLRTMRIKAEGTAEVAPGQARLPFTLEDIWQMPDRYKTSNHVRFNGKDLLQTQVIDGDTGWMSMNGTVRNLPPAARTEMKEQKHGEDFDRLGFLKQPGIKLAIVPEVEVHGAPAVGVRIDSTGHRPVTLYFDKKTNLLVKRLHPILDPMTGAEVPQEVSFSEHQPQDGVMHYRKITAYRDGKPFLEAKVTEIEFLDKIDDKTFAKP